MTLHLADRLGSEERALLDRVGKVADEVEIDAYLIGGSVRDLLLEQSRPDIDIAVDGPVEAIVERLAERLGADVRKTTDFMTATLVLEAGLELDLARTRSEQYPEPGALPMVAPADIEADLRRRDFTVNAMAMHLAPGRFGELIDPLGAIDDLRAGRLRVLHDDSFVDDPTRLYRAVRFMLRLNFTLETHTRELLERAVEQRRPALVSGARIRNELSMIFQQSPGRALEAIQRLGLFEAAGLRGASEAACDAAALMPNAAEALRTDLRAAGPMAAGLGLYCALSKQDPLTLAVRLMLGRTTRRRIREAARTITGPPAALESSGPDSELFFALQGLSSAAAVALWTVLDEGARDRLEHYWLSLRDTTADIDGTDLTRAGCEPGPRYAAALCAALAAKLDEGAGRDEQLQAAMRAIENAATEETV